MMEFGFVFCLMGDSGETFIGLATPSETSTFQNWPQVNATNANKKNQNHDSIYSGLHRELSRLPAHSTTPP